MTFAGFHPFQIWQFTQEAPKTPARAEAIHFPICDAFTMSLCSTLGDYQPTSMYMTKIVTDFSFDRSVWPQKSPEDGSLLRALFPAMAGHFD
jgi:hypothetical protein